MNELMIALTKLAEAGIKYLEAKKSESEGFLELARKRAEKDLNPLAPAAAPEKSEPALALKPEGEAAPKRARRTKEQIAADEAAAAALKTEQSKNNVPTEPPAQPPAAQPPAPAANPFSDAPSQPPAPAAENPLGDGSSLAPHPLRATPPPPPAAAPKTLNEQESYDKMVKVMASFVGLAKNDTPNGLEQNRAYLKEKFKIAKIGDLTHEMRLQVITDTEVRIAAYKKPVK